MIIYQIAFLSSQDLWWPLVLFIFVSLKIRMDAPLMIVQKWIVPLILRSPESFSVNMACVMCFECWVWVSQAEKRDRKGPSSQRESWVERAWWLMSCARGPGESSGGSRWAEGAGKEGSCNSYWEALNTRKRVFGIFFFLKNLIVKENCGGS